MTDIHPIDGNNEGFPLVSVIVPAYNVKDCVRESLNSIVQQTYPNLEIIVIDDGSTDGTGSLLDEYFSECSRVFKLMHKKNGGVSFARNQGLAASKGKFVVFVDADDVIGVNHIATMVDLACSMCADLVITGYSCRNVHYQHSDNKCVSCEIMSQEAVIRESFSPRGRFASHVWGKLYSRKLWDGVRFPEGLDFGEDQAVFYKLVLEADSIVFEDANDYYYFNTRLGSASNVPSSKRLENWLKFLAVLEGEREELSERLPSVLPALQKRCEEHFGGVVLGSVRLGHASSANLLMRARECRRDVLLSRDRPLKTKICYAATILPTPVLRWLLRIFVK